MKKCCAKVKPNSVVGVAEETARVDQILKSGVGEETEEVWKEDFFFYYWAISTSKLADGRRAQLSKEQSSADEAEVGR